MKEKLINRINTFLNIFRRRKNRYFIISYFVINDGKPIRIGRCSFETLGTYLNQLKAEDYIRTFVWKDNCNIVINNIIELNKNDYNYYFKKS